MPVGWTSRIVNNAPTDMPIVQVERIMPAFLSKLWGRAIL
jgi:hypothetical protein